MTTYCDVNTCEDCPRYGDDCDGDKRVEHTDYISRADAIEAVRKEYEDAINIGDNGDAVAYDVGRILSALPSAKYVTEKPNDAVKASNDVINRADAIEAVAIAICKDYDEIDALKALPSADAEWIPCSERLPEEGEKVLASTTNTVFTQVFKGTHGTSDSWWWNNNTIKTIYAWMPLPEPYREDGEA